MALVALRTSAGNERQALRLSQDTQRRKTHGPLGVPERLRCSPVAQHSAQGALRQTQHRTLEKLQHEARSALPPSLLRRFGVAGPKPCSAFDKLRLTPGV